jgi:hypothetical protein
VGVGGHGRGRPGVGGGWVGVVAAAIHAAVRSTARAAERGRGMTARACLFGSLRPRRTCPPRPFTIHHSPSTIHHSPLLATHHSPLTFTHPATLPPACFWKVSRPQRRTTRLPHSHTLPLPLPLPSLMAPRLLRPRLSATALPSLCTCSISIAQDAARARNHSNPGPPSPLAPCRLAPHWPASTTLRPRPIHPCPSHPPMFPMFHVHTQYPVPSYIPSTGT